MTWDEFMYWVPALIVVLSGIALGLNFRTKPLPVWSMAFNGALLIYGLIRCYFVYWS